MNATDIHGFWETSSPNVPGTKEYMHLAPDGKMLSLGRMPLDDNPSESWFKLWYSYRLTEDGEFAIHPYKNPTTEQVFTIECDGQDTLILDRKNLSPFERRFTRVPWTTPPDFLEKHLRDAHRQLAEREDR
ncbi:hypothetical protein [Prosthecobacter sp.]|uniref:hypothetical protein n=1 Tax=Prosthecobacter sp. TaxID=1965333 RepID=UPI001D5A0B78|nr:hypothetical protein [Prosthecobacter sp.]MCB1275509.1 hypothetical protein [Prosthecobacter sp.]